METPNLLFYFNLNVFQKVTVAGILARGKHHVLPDEQSKLVRGVVEVVALVDPTTPDAKHVHVRLLGRQEQVCDVFWSGFFRKDMCGNPVGSLCIYGDAVHLEVKLFCIQVTFDWVFVQFDKPESNSDSLLHNFRPHCDPYGQVVEFLFAVS